MTLKLKTVNPLKTVTYLNKHWSTVTIGNVSDIYFDATGIELTVFQGYCVADKIIHIDYEDMNSDLDVEIWR